MINSFGKGTKLINLELLEVDKVLMLCAKLVGIKNENQPDKEEQLFLMRAILKYFGNITDEQLKTAFELYASGKLLADEHYQSFNFKFISSILNAYITEVNNTINFYQSKVSNIEQPKQVQQEVDWTSTYEYLLKEVEEENKNLLIPIYLYEWLIKSSIYIPTAEEKKHAMNMGRKLLINRYTKEWKERPTRNLKLKIEEIENLKQGEKGFSQITDEAKKYLIQQHLEKAVKEKKEAADIKQPDQENANDL